MADGQYGGGEAYPPRGRPRVSRAPAKLVSGLGEFAAPPSENDIAPRPLLQDGSDAPTIIFDDEPEWKKPLGELQTVLRPAPVRETEAREGKPKKKMKPADESDGGRRPIRVWLYSGIITLSLLCVCVLCVMMMPQTVGYFWKDFGNYAFINGELLRYDAQASAAYKQYREYMTRGVIYPGIFVDGVHVGDMTVDEAREALTAVGSDSPAALSVTVAIGDKTWLFDGSTVSARRDLGDVLERAYAIGRTNTAAIQSTLQTPFRERVNRVMALRESGVNLTTTASYDHDAVRARIDEIGDYVTREPIDAQILTFDYKTRTFTFTKDEPGVTLDRDALYDKVVSALDKWEKGVVVTADPVITQAKITNADLSARFGMIAAFTTDTTKDSNRNTNIDLACQAINGTALMPGEEFSFNAATGQRTTDKGYKSAGAIAAGQSIEEVGGGICQVSSTIFNAVARADLQITSRSPHAWPSTYVNRGEDATVNWPNLDFKFKNNTDSPIFLITYYENRKLSAEIWGLTLGDGVSIDLESVTTRAIDPPSGINYVLNPELPFGASETTVKARTGYVVETYKVWLKDGKEIKRELLHTSTYKAYQQVVEYN